MANDARLQPGPEAAAVCLTGGLCLAAALAGGLLSRQPGGLASLWYAGAVAVAALQARPDRAWLAHLAACAAGLLGAQRILGQDWPPALWQTAVHTLEIALGSHLLRRYGLRTQDLPHAAALVAALGLGSVLPGAIGATLAVAGSQGPGLGLGLGLGLGDRLDLPRAAADAPSWATAWVSDAAGSALGGVSVLPLGLLLATRGTPPLRAALRRPAAWAALALAVATALSAPAWGDAVYVLVSVALVLLALVLLAVVAGYPGVALGVLPCALSVDVLVALGRFEPAAGTGLFGELLFFLPLSLTFVPPLLLGVALDRQRAALDDLERRESHFRTVYERTPAMMHSVDIDRRLLTVNDAWLQRLGYTRDEVLGRRSTEFLTPESRRRAEESVIPRFLREGRLEDVEYQMQTKSGAVLDVLLSAIWETDAQGRPLRTLAVLKDITEQKRLAGALAAEKERIEVTLHSIGDGVVSTDEHGRVGYLNPVAEGMLGRSLAQMQGQAFAEVVQLFDQATGGRLPDPVAQCLQDRQPHKLPPTAVLRDANGRDWGVQVSLAPILARDGAVRGAVMVFQDVTETRHQAQHMAYLALHDGLTGLPNRVLFLDRVHQACQYGHRHQQAFAVAFMDLDHFKQVNDTHGHAVGDELLKAVAQRLGSALRGSDTVCRLGGDEFVLLLSELAGPADAAAVAGKLLATLAQPCALAGQDLQVGASLGLAMFPGDGTDPDTLLRHADAAMYRAKNAGRHCARFYADPHTELPADPSSDAPAAVA